MKPVRLEACSDDLRDLLIGSLPYNEYEEDLASAIANFAKMVAQQLVIDGTMPFEIQGGWDQANEKPQLTESRLVFVYPESLMTLGKLRYQVVPPDAAPENPNGRVVRLDSGRIVTFTLPKEYQRSLERIRSGLPVLGQSQHAWMMQVGQRRVHEDFKTVNRFYDVHRARLTAPIGWNARGLFRDHITDFHWTCRELQWQRFCIHVRDAILRTIGRLFLKIGSLRGEAPRLQWEHLPTLEQVNEAESRLASGARFEQVLEPFRYSRR